MEANFALESNNKMHAYEGKIMVQFLKNIFLIEDQEFISCVIEIFSLEYLDSY